MTTTTTRHYINIKTEKDQYIHTPHTPWALRLARTAPFHLPPISHSSTEHSCPCTVWFYIGVWNCPHLHNPPKPVPDVRGYDKYSTTVRSTASIQYITQSTVTSDASTVLDARNLVSLVKNAVSISRRHVYTNSPYSVLRTCSHVPLPPYYFTQLILS